jgi:hypothetical protein
MDDIIRQAIHDFRAYLQRRHYAAHTLANYTLDPGQAHLNYAVKTCKR